jgi:hypothetical protein
MRPCAWDESDPPCADQSSELPVSSREVATSECARGRASSRASEELGCSLGRTESRSNRLACPAEYVVLADCARSPLAATNCRP